MGIHNKDFRVGGVKSMISVKKTLIREEASHSNKNSSLAISATRINEGSSEVRDSFKMKKANINLPQAAQEEDFKEKTMKTPLNHGSSHSN
jgi:hypothetical protein